MLCVLESFRKHREAILFRFVVQIMLNNDVNTAESRLTGIPVVDGELAPSGLASGVGGGGVSDTKNRVMTTTLTSSAGQIGTSTKRSTELKPIEYKNGRKIEQLMYSYETYFKHKEKIPKQYYPLVQYLENVEVKYHNDNLFEDTPIGFPTRAQ